MQCDLTSLRNTDFKQLLGTSKQQKRKNANEQDEQEAARNYATFHQVINVCKNYKYSSPVVSCTYGAGHNMKLSTSAVEFLADTHRITSEACNDLEYQIWLGLVNHGEIRADADVEGLTVEDCRELATHQTRLIQKLGGLYRRYGLAPRKYFRRAENQGNGYKIALA